jgi:hypothetical protein
MKSILNFFNPNHTGKYPAEALPEFVTNIIYIPRVIFWLSFICGTGLLLLYLIIQDISLVIIGFYYVYAATFFNLFILAIIIISSLFSLKYFLLLIQKTSILLLNIPIAIGYFYLLTYLDMLL